MCSGAWKRGPVCPVRVITLCYSNWIQIFDFLSHVTLKFDGWLNKANLGYSIAATGLLILLALDSYNQFFSRMTLKFDEWPCRNNKAPLLCYFKFCISFQSHQWIQTWVSAQKRTIRVKIDDFFVTCDLEIWWITLKNNRAPVLCSFKFCESFHSHQ